MVTAGAAGTHRAPNKVFREGVSWSNLAPTERGQNRCYTPLENNQTLAQSSRPGGGGGGARARGASLASSGPGQADGPAMHHHTLPLTIVVERSQYCDTMKSATVRDLRYDFPRLEAWLKGGEEILITKHSRPIGRLVPASDPGISAPATS